MLACVVMLGLLLLFMSCNSASFPEIATEASTAFLYYGAEGETLTMDAVSEKDRLAGEPALRDADYFGAFAIWPAGQTGA